MCIRENFSLFLCNFSFLHLIVSQYLQSAISSFFSIQFICSRKNSWSSVRLFGTKVFLLRLLTSGCVTLEKGVDFFKHFLQYQASFYTKQVFILSNHTYHSQVLHDVLATGFLETMQGLYPVSRFLIALNLKRVCYLDCK